MYLEIQGESALSAWLSARKHAWFWMAKFFGTVWNSGQPISVFAINDSGEVIGGGGFPNRPYNAYVWKDGEAIDLGVLDGDCFSEAEVINA
jgi:probable HAF family extracellular repeat protein